MGAVSSPTGGKPPSRLSHKIRPTARITVAQSTVSLSHCAFGIEPFPRANDRFSVADVRPGYDLEPFAVEDSSQRIMCVVRDMLVRTGARCTRL